MLTIWGGLGVLTLALVTGSTTRVDAHKAKISPYAYNTEIFPILRDKCGRCHAEGGPAPMSLMTYDTDGGAIAWAESMREMLLIGAMPPWYADPSGPAVRNHEGLTARQLDTLITWIVGGTPHGDLSKTPPPVQAPTGWTMGKPDLTLQMPEPFALGPGTMQASTEAVIPTGLTEEKWVKAADVLPGVPSMVRRAFVSLEGGPLLALWEPGDEAIAAPSGAAFKLPAGAKLHLKIDYKKSWQDEQKSLEDRSQVGLYFTEAPLSGKSIESASIDASAAESGALEPTTFSGTLAKAGRVIAVRPMLDEAYANVEVTAIAASGRKVPLLKLRNARPEWPRRYWLVDPVELPANTKIEVSLVPGDPDTGPLVKPEGFPLQVALDIVPQ
ncbi:MAG: hypothetical protein AB7Q29_17060 [Vicinamibacterales bacterium]